MSQIGDELTVSCHIIANSQNQQKVQIKYVSVSYLR